MSTTVKWLFSVNPTNGPKLAPNGTLDVEAYELIDIDVAGGGGTSALTLPAPNSDLSLLMITASKYSTEDGLLTYTINGGGTDIQLDAPLCLIGKGAIEYLIAASGGSSDPAELEFTNNIGTVEDTTAITILVGRKAIV